MQRVSIFEAYELHHADCVDRLRGRHANAFATDTPHELIEEPQERACVGHLIGLCCWLCE